MYRTKVQHGRCLGRLKNAAPVHDRPQSHIHTEYKKIDEILPLVLSEIVPLPDSAVFTHSHDFEEVIGESIRVQTDENDTIIYAQRPNRAGLTRFVKNRSLRPTSVFTVVLKRDALVAAEQYILMTAYVGEPAPPEPWDKMATSESMLFWNSNALVWGSVPILPGTETVDCPW